MVPELTDSIKVLMEMLGSSLIELFVKLLLRVNMRRNIFCNLPGFNLDRDGNVLGHLV